MEITKAKINKLGERIRKEKTLENDPKLLDNFRASYGEAFKEISTDIKKILKHFSKETTLTNRQTKTSISIREKLVRLKGRLSEMQDIRGCRIVTDNLIVSDKIIQKIKNSEICISDKSLVEKNSLRRDDIGYRATQSNRYGKRKTYRNSDKNKIRRYLG